MDEYDKKFAEMQTYIPFLEAMIERLQKNKEAVKNKDNREIQLQKMQSLHEILSDSKRKLKIETLQRCEDVLQKLYNRIEKGNTPGLQLLTKQTDGTTPQPSTSSENMKSDQYKKTGQQDMEKDIEIEETPASPDTVRSSSPECQILPVIIPTERSTDLSTKRRRQFRKIPVITLTDRTREITISSPTDSNPEDVSFSEWDMLEESERHNITKNRGDRQSSQVASSHDVATAAKLISNNLPQKVNDGRNYALDSQDIPTVPVPSLGGSRRLTSVLEKNKLNLNMITDNNSSRAESPVNVPEVRLKSPDPEILFAKPMVTPPRPKDNHNTSSKLPSKPSSIPLLFSPPPLSNEPPLSMEDLAELLNEGDSDKRSDKMSDNVAKHKKDLDKQEAAKDGKISKNPLLSDRENEKRSEEADKHTTKITPRKCLSNAAGTSGVKSSEIKGLSHQLNDHRSVPQTSFSNSKYQEPRYADNYERHPRQRDSHGHESAKDKSAANSNIPEETPQISILYHNIANKSDERNVPLYQRRSNLPLEGRKDSGGRIETAPSRPESEFVIEGIDFYNMHVSQIQWQPSAITSNDHAFGNVQWTSPAYGGIAQSSLQPTQHPYQHPMESQFRPNQFPTGPTLPTGPRPLITPTARSQDMNHVTVRPENIRENIPPLMSSPAFPVASQYRGFQMGQGSYDPAFTVDRSTEYPHVRPNWEGPANRTGENVIPCGIQVTENPTGTSYPRPSTPYPWGTRDRCNIGRGRDGYYEKNRTEVRPGFNRRPDWSRDSFPNRDPRVRTEHNTTSLNQIKETGGSARDPRLAKDKHVNTPTKVKNATQNEKDPKKRSTITKTTKEKNKSQKSEPEKEKIDKLPKDRMQSPLESLYGVIDTKANQSSGLQKFKIPKIKRPEPPQSSCLSNKTKETESISCSLSHTKSDNKKKNKNSRFENTNKDDASAEVSSSSDSSHVTKSSVQSNQNNTVKEREIISSLVEETNKNEVKIGEADSVTSDSKLNDVEKSKKNESEADDSKSKEEVTQEWIEALIRKSFESGEGKKLFEQAKLIQKLGEALETKKLKKIKKIIESESESSSDKDEAKVEEKKTSTKKKRRVIVSDSSDDEYLAERLGVLTTNFDASDERTVASTTDLKNLEEKNETAVSDNVNKELVKDVTVKKNNSSSRKRDEKRNTQDDNNKSKNARVRKKSNKESDRSKNSNKKSDPQSENKKQVNNRLEDDDKAKKKIEDKINQSIEKFVESIEKSKDKNNSKRSLDQDKDQTAEYVEPISEIADGGTDETSNDKPKIKTKRRNSLEMLQEDIREMFISEGVVTATGHRMCRLLKEDQPAVGTPGTLLTSSKKDEASGATENKVAESSIEAVMNNKSKKSLRSRNIGQSNKSKIKNKKDIKRKTRNLRSKESIPNSDSEEDQPLALRTEKLNSADNKTPNQEEDCEEINDPLRRSKRILRKDVAKEPRVIVEKTDFAKIDSSKVMFDSSSDESFGIDVSKLAAAVDVSLRPEQSDQDSEDTTTSLRSRHVSKNVNKRNSKSRKTSLLNDNEDVNDGMYFTDEESALSDISMSSSTIAGKRTSGAARTSTREELLSNILVGLVPATTEKNRSLTDKGSEADLDEDTNEPSITETNAKKTKKKKKKSSWQMGIVTTKKKKKKTASPKTAQTNIEEINTENNVSMNAVNNQSTSEDNKTATIDKPPEHNHTVNDTNTDFLVKCDIKPPINTNNFDVDYNELNLALSESLDAIKEALSNESLISIEEIKPIIKMETKEAESTTQAVVIAPQNANTNATLSKETLKIAYDEQMEELFRRIEIKQLTDYIWNGQDKYKCLLCIFTGKNIVHHYKTNHSGREVLIARLSPTNAETAILESSATVASAVEITNQICKFRCRFCYYVTEGAVDVALEAFYEHCTTHTGEYRFRCNSCSYQAVAKASMRTHYYKMCRKHNDTFNDAASEDEVPREGIIYGYLCRGCNYVQLKRHNVEAHVMFWHRDKTNIEILKINMSASVENVANSNEEMSREPPSVSVEESFVIETKPKISEFEGVENKDVLENIVTEVSQNNNDKTEEYIIHEPKMEEAIDIKEEEIGERSGMPGQEEPEGSVSTGNLSVFVCPPELENKEDEIQRERQKMMQEIAHNIGILKNHSKPGLSIIDKLQDKMRTDAVVSPVPECDSSVDIPEIKENSLLLTNSIVESLKIEDNIIIKEDVLSQPNSQEDPSSTEEQSVTDKPEITNDKADGIKIRDPLAIMDPCKKDDESDGEISDNERSAPIFESDSSSEQSDSELPTDVNMILKETSSMNASSSRDPMLTTIQRLAAQLQNVKPLEPVPEPILDIKVEIKSDPMSSIPHLPDVVSTIATAKRLVAKESNDKHWSKMETPMLCADASPPKNFIRFRRLSGDMLSMPIQSDNQEETRASSTDGTQSDSAIDVSQAEEERSFLKIENVISLAPRSDNIRNENPIINDIRKAMETSPKNKGIPTILRKSNQPIILKKLNIIPQPLVKAQTIQPTTAEHVTLFPIKNSSTTSAKPVGTHRLATNFVPIAPKMRQVTISSANPPNLKILKVVRTPMPLITVSKDVPKSFSSIATKIKSVEAYTAMLTETKLVHFFKCMGRDCHYTTDSMSLYSQHYQQHGSEASKRNNSVQSYDYEKCAYCYMSLNNWTSMQTHLWEKHGPCRYQCVYCFYRALTPSYVQQHQVTCHPGSRFYFLLGKMLKPIQKQEDINREDFMKPFVCKQDCKQFYTFETFAVHLKEHQFSHFTCHLCNSVHVTIKSLISHYKLHGYFKYQCVYCLHGTDTLIEMHQHLSTLHYNRLPQTLERMFSPTVERSADVIQQLIMRTFDEPVKVDERNTESSVDNSKKNTSIKDANDKISTTSLNVEIASNLEQSNAPNNSTVPNFINEINCSNVSNVETSVIVFNTSEKQSIDAFPTGAIAENASKNAVEKQSLQNKSFLQESEKGNLNQIVQEQERLSRIDDSSTENPLELSGEFNCSDEFVNTNLLDNPEFLKNIAVNSSNVSLSNGATVSADKTEDSDIEILENIGSEKKIAETKNVEHDANHLTADSKSFIELKIEKKEQSAICDTSENKCISVKASTSTCTDVQSEKPLTLDDIKDTGRAGLELYKCGYLECSFAAPDANLLKAHIKKCNFGEPIRNLFCPHCKKRFIRIGFLLEHMKTHGLKRFGCSLCKVRYAVSYQATAHMKTKHKHLNTKLVPADPTNPSVEGLFIVHAIPFGSAERKSKKRKGAKSGVEQEIEKTDIEKLSFSPDELEQLPRQAIYNREIQCAVCPYTTKVRTNIIRHLQLHAKDQTVPESGPVNPVPCLDKKEKMFDKMVNLASSSHQNGRMGGKLKEVIKESKEDDGIPKFVPEHKRYVCSVAECNYLTVDEAMLRYHLKALHSEEPYFRCPHCPPPPPGQESQNIAIDKMGVHLKMHDTRLYKCSHCNHHHYHRHVVERHLTDKHPEKRPFVKVVREIENTENVQQPVNEETEEEVPDPDGNHWKCNLCDFKCVYKADITAHADTIHGESGQYKCILCSFKTSGKIILEQHITSKHAYDSNADYTVIYQRIKAVNKRNVETTEQSGQDEPFDTTPLWTRNMPRIRHIRGILLEEEIEDPVVSEGSSSTTSKVSLGKRKSDTEISTKPTKMRSKLGDEINKQFKEKSKRSLSCDKLSEETEGNGQNKKENEQSKSNTARDINKSTNDSKKNAVELTDSDVGRFGPYGKPDGNLYICTLCNHFKTKYKHDMRDHLFRELNYARWHCKACGYLSVNRNALIQHFGKRHNGESPDHEPLSPDNAIEDWVMTLLKKQTDMIKAASKNINIVYKSPKSDNTSAGSRENDNAISPKKPQTDKRTVNLAPTISNLQSDILRDANRSSIDTDDGDSRDNEDLVIDMKDDDALENKNNENKLKDNKFCEKNEKVSEKPFVCKHCQMIFNRPRGLKLHIQYSHLKRLGFLCPYCDRSTNSETMMRQHIRSKHPKDPEKIIHNPSAWENAKLTNEFWEKEYGLVCPLKLKKRKLNTEDAGDATAGNRADMREKCEVCGFMAMNYTGLKSHMRSHATSKHNLKCSYCTYSCSFKAELLEHWEFNHPMKQLKYQELSSTAGSSCGEVVNKSSTSKKQEIACDALNDIEEEENEEEEEEEEPAISVGKSTPTTIYSCFYCIFRSNSLPSVKRHWSLAHKESKGPETAFNAKINLPFKYKEIPLSRLSSPKDYANKNVVKTSPRDFVERSEKLSSIVVQRHGWVCQWCDDGEFYETDTDRITHHNMFHSHLPQKWQEQRQQKQDQKGTSIRFSAYSATKYSSLAAKTESIPNLNSTVENLMVNQARRDFGDTAMKSTHIPGISILKGSSAGGTRQAVAKKSTTKSIAYARPGPRVFKAVARKSTNPLPRYPSSTFMSYRSIPRRIETELEMEVTESESSSHYGRQSSPINLAELNTYMVVGGHSMRLTCLTLSTLININPKVILKDIRKDYRYAAILSNSD